MTKSILTLFLILAGCAIHGDPEQPNILLIYADDVGYGDPACYGGTGVDTPALDLLAREGLRFTSAYATASTCTPSRYSLLTGEYPFRNNSAKVLPGNAPMIIDPGKPTLASVLKERGYATGLVGKWHLGLGTPDRDLDWNGLIAPGPKELGFDYSFHMAATGDRVPTVFIENGRIVGLDPDDPVQVSYREPVGNDPTGNEHPELLKVQADWEHGKTIVNGVSRIGYMSGGQSARWVDEDMPDTFLGKAVGFIEDNQNRPFFLYYATHEIHVPRVPHQRFRGSSSLGVRGDALAQMDWGIHILLETLKRLDLEKDTLVIFSSDNGPVLYDGYWDGAREMNQEHRPAGPWRGGKYSVWEGGTRMPLIVRWLGKVDPGLTDAVVSQVDLLASLASLTGAVIPPGYASDGIDLIDTFLGKSDTGRASVLQQGIRGWAIRQGDWKYIPPGVVFSKVGIRNSRRDPIPEPGALFFLPEDPAELNDLSAKYPAKVGEMRRLLEEQLHP